MKTDLSDVRIMKINRCFYFYNISFSIKNKNSGFKHFISHILTITTKVFNKIPDKYFLPGVAGIK
jgi:hypothetical protein